MTKTIQSGQMASSERMFRRTASVDPQARLGAMARITRMAFRYPVRAGLDLLATVAAAKATPETLYPIALLLLLASVARGLFTLVQNYTAESVGHALAGDIGNAVYGKIQSLPFLFHDRTHSGNLITPALGYCARPNAARIANK